MTKFCTSSEHSPEHSSGQSSEHSSVHSDEHSTCPSREHSHGTAVGKVVIPYININKQITNINKRGLPENENEVFDFFKNRKWPFREAKKFYNHYSSIGWFTNGKLKIIVWHSTAENWMIRDEEIKK